jgi:hypothetical protein
VQGLLATFAGCGFRGMLLPGVRKKRVPLAKLPSLRGEFQDRS